RGRLHLPPELLLLRPPRRRPREPAPGRRLRRRGPRGERGGPPGPPPRLPDAGPRRARLRSGGRLDLGGPPSRPGPPLPLRPLGAPPPPRELLRPRRHHARAHARLS